MTIFQGSRVGRTIVEVRNTPRPRCDHALLQREWANDLRTAGTEPPDGESTAAVRARREIAVTRRGLRRAFGEGESALSQRVERLREATGGLPTDITSERSATLAAIAPLADEIRAATEMTDEPPFAGAGARGAREHGARERGADAPIAGTSARCLHAAFMELRFPRDFSGVPARAAGAPDFSRVRLHDDATAARSATEAGAVAYAVGNHVVLGANSGDRSLLAHGSPTSPRGCRACSPRRRPALPNDPVQSHVRHRRLAITTRRPARRWTSWPPCRPRTWPTRCGRMERDGLVTRLLEEHRRRRPHGVRLPDPVDPQAAGRPGDRGQDRAAHVLRVPGLGDHRRGGAPGARGAEEPSTGPAQGGGRAIPNGSTSAFYDNLKRARPAGQPALPAGPQDDPQLGDDPRQMSATSARTSRRRRWPRASASERTSGASPPPAGTAATRTSGWPPLPPAGSRRAGSRASPPPWPRSGRGLARGAPGGARRRGGRRRIRLGAGGTEELGAYAFNDGRHVLAVGQGLAGAGGAGPARRRLRQQHHAPAAGHQEVRPDGRLGHHERHAREPARRGAGDRHGRAAASLLRLRLHGQTEITPSCASSSTAGRAAAATTQLPAASGRSSRRSATPSRRPWPRPSCAGSAAGCSSTSASCPVLASCWTARSRACSASGSEP